MNEQILIRAYTEEDQEQVLELFRLNTPKYFAPHEEKDLLHYLQHETEEYFVLEYAGIMAGCGGINFSPDKSTGILSWDIIHPEYQGQSLGSSLLQFRMNRLREHPALQLIRVRTSQFAYRFYEKAGFALMEKVEHYWAPGFHLYRMEYQPSGYQS